MKLRSLLLIPVIGASLMLAGCENPFAPTGSGSAVHEVAPEAKAAIEQYVAKINAHDAPGAGELYADDQGFLWIENGEVVHETKTAAVAALTNYFNGFPESHFEAYDMKISMLTDESAVAAFRYTQTVAANGQSSLKFEGTMTLTLAERDGDWKIVTGHRSASRFPH
jgi:uncharacterized protein (TIGR02246 family)